MNRNRKGKTRSRKHKNKQNPSKAARGSLTPPPARPKASPLNFGEFKRPSKDKKKRSRYGEETKRPVWGGSAFPSISRPKLSSAASVEAGKTSPNAPNDERSALNEARKPAPDLKEFRDEGELIPQPRDDGEADSGSVIIFGSQ
jgi:hypothetical protein